MNELLTSGYLSDFTIVACIDSEGSGPLLRIAVHKLVLSPRSPVFKAMLESVFGTLLNLRIVAAVHRSVSTTTVIWLL
jgi:hypothetical protein